MPSFPIFFLFNYPLIELASLTHSQLMEKVKTLQTLAYQLGMIEGVCVCLSVCVSICLSVCLSVCLCCALTT